jgi:periplasmic divalent cation tolerance protein
VKTNKFFLVLVTAPDLKTARSLAKSTLAARLAACANLVSRVESHYWWQGKLESGNEVLMILKTTKTMLKPLQKHIVERHPYDTPEFIAVAIDEGNPRYLSWLSQSVSKVK